VGVALKSLLKELLREEKEQYGEESCSEQMIKVVLQLICQPLQRENLDENTIITLRALFNELDLRNK
jgi:hypothetical protein